MRLPFVPAPSNGISLEAFADMDRDRSLPPLELRLHCQYSAELPQSQQSLRRNYHRNRSHQQYQPPPPPTPPPRELFHPYQWTGFGAESLPAAPTTRPRCGRLPSIATLLSRSRMCSSEMLPRCSVSQSPGLVARSDCVVRPIPRSIALPTVRLDEEGLGKGVGVKRLRQEDQVRAEKKPRFDSLVALDGCGSSTNPSEAGASTGKQKQSRYLREMDRRSILERLAHGERQADLAKEFNVSRAAICNLNKHRDAVLSRQNEHPFAKHPKRRGYKKAKEATRSPQSLQDDV